MDLAYRMQGNQASEGIERVHVNSGTEEDNTVLDTHICSIVVKYAEGKRQEKDRQPSFQFALAMT